MQVSSRETPRDPKSSDMEADFLILLEFAFMHEFDFVMHNCWFIPALGCITWVTPKNIPRRAGDPAGLGVLQAQTGTVCVVFPPPGCPLKLSEPLLAAWSLPMFPAASRA